MTLNPSLASYKKGADVLALLWWRQQNSRLDPARPMWSFKPDRFEPSCLGTLASQGHIKKDSPLISFGFST